MRPYPGIIQTAYTETDIRRCRRALWWTFGLNLYSIVFRYRGLVIYSFLPSFLYFFDMLFLVAADIGNIIYVVYIAIKYYRAPHYISFHPLIITLFLHYAVTLTSPSLSNKSSYCSYFRDERVALIDSFCSGKLDLEATKGDHAYKLPPTFQHLTLSNYSVVIHCNQDLQTARFLITGMLNNGHELMYKSDDSYPQRNELPTNNQCKITRLEKNWFYLVY